MERPSVSEAQRLALASVEETMQSLLERINFETLDPPSPRGRPRLVSAALFWSAVLACVIRGTEHFRPVWRAIAVEGLWGYAAIPVEDEAVYRRLKSDSSDIARELLFRVQALVKQQARPARREDGFARGGVFAIDDTVLDAVEKKSNSLRKRTDTVLAGRVSTIFDIRKNQITHVEISDDPEQNEKKTARTLLARLPNNSLLVFDLGYFGFSWFDELTDSGHFYVSRVRAGTSFGETIHTFYRTDVLTDRVVWLGKHRADRAKHAVRVIEILRGTTWHRYMTNQLNPKMLTALDVVRLYASRWNIELAFQLIKRVLGLATIWSSDPNAIRLQVYAILTVAWVVRALREEFARQCKVKVDDVSEVLLMEVMGGLMRGPEPDPIGHLLDLERRGKGCIVRPSRRIQYEVPPTPKSIAILPDNSVLERVPRYAGRKCGPDRR